MAIPPVYSWPLVTPVLTAPSGIPSTSHLAPGLGVASCNPFYYTQADLLALLSRILPAWYLVPLQSPGPGYELMQSFAKTFERASLAVGRTECAAFVIYSHGGARSSCTVEFYRDSTAAGGFTVKRGTVVRATRSQREFVLVADVVFAGGDLVKAGTVEAAGFGPEYDEPGPTVTADGTALPGEVDDLPLPLLDPALAEPTLRVRQVTAATGGQAAVLDQIGLDRNIPRLPGEADESYKGRVAQLPDTISIDAVRRQLDAIFLPRGLEYDVVETWEGRYQSCWGAPDAPTVDPIFGPLVAWAYDDPRTSGFFGRWMGVEDHRAAFVVEVPDVGPISQRGAAWDDPETTAAAFVKPSGRRATGAWDVSLDQDTAQVLLGVWDGVDTQRDTFYRDLHALLRSIVGGGVFFSLEMQE